MRIGLWNGNPFFTTLHSANPNAGKWTATDTLPFQGLLKDDTQEKVDRIPVLYRITQTTGQKKAMNPIGSQPNLTGISKA